MSYERQTFTDGETVLNAAMMTHIEDGIVALQNPPVCTFSYSSTNGQQAIDTHQFLYGMTWRDFVNSHFSKSYNSSFYEIVPLFKIEGDYVQGLMFFNDDESIDGAYYSYVCDDGLYSDAVSDRAIMYNPVRADAWIIPGAQYTWNE